MKKVELLAPAGNLEKLKIAIMYGADAVYIGGKEFSLRARASNFTLNDIKEAVDFANSYNAKIYVTINIIPHNEDLNGLEEYLLGLSDCGVHGLICASPFMVDTAKRVVPHIERHISTQQSTTSYLSTNYWAKEGVTRIVTARELSIEEISELTKKSDIEIEAFIHGGMCVSYSGRCTLSNNMTSRDANRGGCAHSCRWNYKLYEKESQLNPSDIPFSMSSKDLMGVRFIPKLIDAGVASVKIEGRMKSVHYIATVVSTYRKLIDEYYDNNFVISDDRLEYYIDEISKAENRLTAEGFYNGPTTIEEQLYNMRSEKPTQEFIAYVLDYKDGIATIEQRNYFEAPQLVEVFGPEFKDNQVFMIDEIFDEDMNLLDAARHPKQILKVKVPIEIYKYNMIRKVRGN